MKKLLPLILFILLAADVFSQCSMCAAVASSNAETGQNNVGQTLNTGILYLMALPYIIVGSILFFFYRKQIKEKLRQFAAGNSAS